MFGLFGSFTSSAQVIATAAIKGGGSGTLAVTGCQTTSPTNTQTEYITLVNSGTGSTAADLVTLTFGGNTYTASVISASCGVGASGSSSSTLYIILSGLTGGSGTSYTGSVSLTNGGSPPFSGVFE